MAGPPRKGLTAPPPRNRRPCARAEARWRPRLERWPGPITAKPTEYPRAKCRTRRRPGRDPAALCAARGPRRWRRSPCTASPCTARPSTPRASRISPMSIPMPPRAAALVLGALGTFDSLNPFIIKGVTPRQPARVRLREPAGAQRRRAVHALRADRGERRGARRPQLRHLPPAIRGALLRRPRRSRPTTCCSATQLLKDKGWPYHRSHYGKVAKAEKIGPRSVRFTFDGRRRPRDPADPGPACRSCRSTSSTRRRFERTTLEPPVGSGPYLVARVDAGRSITYRRNPDWWARDLAVTRGRFNFDEIRVEYFRDAASLFEAFKAGEIDVRPEDDPGRWIEGYGFPAVARRPRPRSASSRRGCRPACRRSSFNTRRPIFADPRVRRAFILLFDAEWINRSLFNGAYKRTQSFFERSELSSHGGAGRRRASAPCSLPSRSTCRPEIAGRHLPPAGNRRQRQRIAPTCRPPSSC